MTEASFLARLSVEVKQAAFPTSMFTQPVLEYSHHKGPWLHLKGQGREKGLLRRLILTVYAPG